MLKGDEKMDIFDDLLRQLTNAADQTLKEAEKFTANAKLKFTIAEEENKLQSLFALVGRRFYDQYKDAQEVPEGFKAAFEEIKAKQEAIDKLRDDQAAKNFSVCPGCKSKIEKGAVYCKICGLRQTDENKK